jgi:hypothetical protein
LRNGLDIGTALDCGAKDDGGIVCADILPVRFAIADDEFADPAVSCAG